MKLLFVCIYYKKCLYVSLQNIFSCVPCSTGLEYAYSEAPRSFQSLIMGLFYAMEGVGSFLGIALLQLVARFWFNNLTDFGNINENHLDFYLYFLGVIQMAMMIVYGVTIYVSRFSLELVPLPSDEGKQHTLGWSGIWEN